MPTPPAPRQPDRQRSPAAPAPARSIPPVPEAGPSSRVTADLDRMASESRRFVGMSNADLSAALRQLHLAMLPFLSEYATALFNVVRQRLTEQPAP